MTRMSSARSSFDSSAWVIRPAILLTIEDSGWKNIVPQTDCLSLESTNNLEGINQKSGKSTKNLKGINQKSKGIQPKIRWFNQRSGKSTKNLKGINQKSKGIQPKIRGINQQSGESTKKIPFKQIQAKQTRLRLAMELLNEAKRLRIQIWVASMPTVSEAERTCNHAEVSKQHKHDKLRSSPICLVLLFWVIHIHESTNI